MMKHSIILCSFSACGTNNCTASFIDGLINCPIQSWWTLDKPVGLEWVNINKPYNVSTSLGTELGRF